MIKKILAVSVSVVMTLAMTVSAFAAGSVNTEEQRVLDALTASKVDDSSEQKYFSQAKKFFERDDIDATKAQADEVIGYINEAAAIAKAAGLKSEKDIVNASADVKNQLVDKANKAAAVFGLTVTVDTKTGTVTLSKKKTDSKGNTTTTPVVTTNVNTRATGADSMSSVAVVSVLGLAVAALAVVTKKNAEA